MIHRLEQLRTRVREGMHHRWRQPKVPDVLSECEARHLSWPKRTALLTRRMCESERIVIEPDEHIVFTRTITAIPAIYSPEDWDALIAGRKLHELGPISNICADWGMVLSQGLLGRRAVALKTRQRCVGNAEAVEFLDAAIEAIDAVLALAKRYADAARELGRQEIYECLNHVPASPPGTFLEALQALRLLHAVVWMSGHYHVGLGRFDQYMWPYLKADIEHGRETVKSAALLLAEFFISLNKDSDLYPGVQQGDNGQSLTVGGVKPDGTDGVNPLTSLVLRTALETAMIDPKINLRISPDTSLELLCLASELTRKGLGFPQYSNDAVVIPALASNGYEIEDARNYTVAACWEFIIPGKGMEIVNIGALSFPAAVDKGVREAFAGEGTFTDVLDHTRQNIFEQISKLAELYAKVLLPPAPYYSVLMDGCLETGQDLSRGLKYNNFGIHGAASADAADALAAVKYVVYENQSCSPDELIAALDNDFDRYAPLLNQLMNKAPKIGTNSPEADTYLVWLFDTFADACHHSGGNGRGGRIRPGTGSAMYYVWLAEGHEGMFEPVVGATANGRRRGSYFSANLAPAVNTHVAGPTAVLQSFSQIDYSRVMNGGPITVELADTLFRDEESIMKVAQFIRAFALLGCQQLQLNTVVLDDLIDARIHPELHRNLIVRVWGWSAYFVELAPEYQTHIMQRHLYRDV
jgi:pyruvate-formate lyase